MPVLHAADGPVPGSRPLTARSVIASTLLGVDPPRLPTPALIHSGELFGLRPGATRTALSRMSAAGEVVAEEGHYRLAGALLERHVRQQQARHLTAREWDGTWELAIVRAERRPATQRFALRTAAARCKLVEVREGCWVRPDNLDPTRSPSAWAEIVSQCTVVRGARPETTADWLGSFALDDWAATAEALVAEMEAFQGALDRADVTALPETFQIAAHTLRLLVADPALPAALQPEAWPAEKLRATFDRFDASFKATWRAWYRAFRDD